MSFKKQHRRVRPKKVVRQRPRLGGSIFTHNCVEFDYCIAEALDSLCAVCDDVVVLDAESTDETMDVLRASAAKHGNLRVVEGGRWNCADNYARLAILANEAKSHLKTEWHFMLQADEVIHENSFPAIKASIAEGKHESFFCRRINLFGDLNHFLHFDLPQDKKPCSDTIIRLAKLKYEAVGDAESLGVNPEFVSSRRKDGINVFHYGMVRRDRNHIEKVINMQSWFHGPGCTPDHRVVEMKNRGDGVYDWKAMKQREDLKPIPLPHPVFSRKWAEDRQREKPSLD